MNMKPSDIALLAAAAAAVYLVMSAKRKTGGSASTWTPWKPVTTYEGYQYFNDGQSGLVIDPQGRYILNGVVVWEPPGLF